MRAAAWAFCGLLMAVSVGAQSRDLEITTNATLPGQVVPDDPPNIRRHHKEPVVIAHKVDGTEKIAAAWIQILEPPPLSGDKPNSRVEIATWNQSTQKWNAPKPAGVKSGDPFFALNRVTNQAILAVVNNAGEQILVWPENEFDEPSILGHLVCNPGTGADKPSIHVAQKKQNGQSTASAITYVAHLQGSFVHVHRNYRDPSQGVLVEDLKHWEGVQFLVPTLPGKQPPEIQSPIVLVDETGEIFVVAADYANHSIIVWRYRDDGSPWSRGDGSLTPNNNLPRDDVPGLIQRYEVDGHPNDEAGNLLRDKQGLGSVQAPSMLMARYNERAHTVGIVFHVRGTAGPQSTEAKFVAFEPNPLPNKPPFGNIKDLGADIKPPCPALGVTGTNRFHPAIDTSPDSITFMATYYEGSPTEVVLNGRLLTAYGDPIWKCEQPISSVVSKPAGYDTAMGEYNDVSYMAGRWYASWINITGDCTTDPSCQGNAWVREFPPPLNQKRRSIHSLSQTTLDCVEASDSREIAIGESIALCAEPGSRWQWYSSTAAEPSRTLSDQKVEWVSPTADTIYWYEVDGEDYSDPLFVKVLQDCDLGVIPPSDQTIGADGRATFTVSSTAPDATYTWYEGARGDTDNLVGTGSTFHTPALTETKYYWCRVRSGANCKYDTPSVAAAVCQPPVIVTPGEFSGPALNVTAETTVDLNVHTTGTSVSYAWHLVTMQNSNGSWVPAQDFGPSFAATATASWKALAAHVGKTFGFYVTVTGSCANDVPQTRLVKVVTVVSTDCPAPVIFSGFPAELEARTGAPARLTVFVLAIPDYGPPESDANLQYRWEVNGQLYRNPDGTPYALSGYSTMARFTPESVTLEVTRICHGATDTYSAAVRRSTFVYNAEHCPVPTITPSQWTITETSEVRSFTANSAWPTLRFQWYQGESGVTTNPISGATGKTFTPPAQAGTYWVRATSVCGTRADSPTLTVSTAYCDPIRIVGQPRSDVVKAGMPHTLTFEAFSPRSPLPITYRWFRGTGSNDVAGQSRDLAIPAGQILKTTKYWAQAAIPGCHFANSQIATLHVMACDDVEIAQQPQNAFIDEGDHVLLSIDASSDHSLSYQWYEGETGDDTHPIDFETQSTFDAAPSQTAKYWVRVKVPGGCEVDSVTVTVDVCGKPVPLAGNFEIVSSRMGEQHWLTAQATGDNVHYQWYEGDVGDESRPNQQKNQSSIPVQPFATTNYWYKAISDCLVRPDASANSGRYRISVAPVITTQPVGGPVVRNKTARTLSVEASGAQLQYQWLAGGVEIDGATQASYTTPLLNEDTTYTVRITSGLISVESEPAVVSICMQPTVYWFQTRPQVAAGEQQLVTIGGTVSGLYDRSYSWYIGDSGDVEGSTFLDSGMIVQRDLAPTSTTKYWVRASESNGCYADTPTLTVSVCVPTITAQPQPAFIDKINNAGATATLTVGTTGENLSYQWFTGASGNTSNLLAGKTTPSITVSPEVDTSYWVRVSGCHSPKSSAAALVTVCAKPQITGHPASVIATTPSTTLTVSATGTERTYQWYLGASGNTSQPITTNGSGATLTVSPSVTTDYWVKVSGRCGPSVNSNTARVSVAPTIVTQPSGGYVMPNKTRTLTVAASGTQLGYQWYVGGAPVNGATAASYTTPPLTANATYMVRVSSGSASTDSQAVTLTVCTQPMVSWQNTKTQVAHAEGQTLTIAGSVSGQFETTHTWYVGNSGDVAGSTVLNSGMVVQQQIAPTVTTKYWVRLSETNGCYADTPTLTVNVCIPTITAQPQSVLLDKVANPNATATLSVAANGGALTYQWYIGASGVTSNPISGQTSSSITVSPSADTTYWVRVSGSCGVVRDSAAATVTLCKSPQITTQPAAVIRPANTPTTLAVAASGTDLTYQWYAGASGSGSPITGATGAAFTVTVWTTSDYWIKVSGRCGSMNSNTAKISIPPTISTHPVGGAVTKGSTRTLSVAANGTQLSYQWYSGTSTLIPGATAATFVTAAIQNDITYWVRVWSGNASVDSDPAVFTVCQPRNAVVLSNSYTSNAAVTLRVDTVGSEETYEWYRGESGVTSALVGGGYQITVNPSGTTRYWVRTKRPACDADSPAITVTVCHPAISAQPQSALITSGSTKTLSVTATGTTPLSYQWYIGDSGVTSSPIANATGASYTTPALTTTTKYWVQVRCAADAACSNTAVNSATATVTVCAAPAITYQPQDRVLEYSSSSTTLTVTATGDGLTYQWYEGASGVTTKPVGTGASLLVTPGQTKYYWVRVTGTCGTIDSNALLASVRPTIYSISPPNGSTVCQNSTQTFSVAASGTGLTYQWYRMLPGTSWELFGTTASVTASVPAEMTVYCAVTSGNATASSWPATISVTPSPELGPITKVPSGAWYELRADIRSWWDMPNLSVVWYQGPLGNTSSPVGWSTSFWAPASPSRTYWLRVTNNDDGCYSDAGPVTVP